MDNCPQLNQLNCRNFEIKCDSCICNDLSQISFNYSPMDKSISHPFRLEERELRSNRGKVNNRKGRVNESTVMNKLYKGVPNKSSIIHDGVINLDKDSKLKVEIKTRLNDGVNRKWPTKLEWDKFISKGLDIFLVDSGDGDIRCCMSIHTLNELLILIEGKDSI